VATLVIWLGSKWYYQDWFENPFKYAAKAASLTATVLMCWSVILSTRARFLENHFGGLDKVYQVHKHLGKWALSIILLHPFFLAADRILNLPEFMRGLWFVPAGGSRYLIGHNVGVATLLMMGLLLFLTLRRRLPYHVWKKTHEWLGLVLAMAMAHVITVQRDVASYPFLAGWMYGWMILAAASFVYIRFLYRFVGPHSTYRVAIIEWIGDILELTLTPRTSGMDFKPSQFIYLVVHKTGITPEPHPYSIACGYNVQSTIKLGIKRAGDHTATLDLLEAGDPVTLYGPYGRFSEAFLRADRDCIFIAGGIGITPFMGMWHVALHTEERVEKDDLPEDLRRLHPEMMRRWKSPRVALFYVCNNEEQASFENDIKNEVTLSQSLGFGGLKERGHHYELYLASRQGLISAAYIDRHVPGGALNKYIFLCGPSPMMASLMAQFKSMGVRKEQIIIEDFNLV
jgi:predicted ferric reductase